MKIQARQIDAFVKSPPAALRAALLYGPDMGLARERAAVLGRTVVADLNDPFNVGVLPAEAVAADTARLIDEASAISMMGGKRLIRIADGRDAIAPAVRDYLKAPNDRALLVIEAGELGPKSPLRILFEKSEHAAALPCYVEAEEDVAAFARTALRDQGYGIAPDALGWLASAIAGDRRRVRAEIDKLMLYMGANRQITMGDVLACCGEAGAQALDALVYGAGGAKPDEAFRAFGHLVEEGVPAIAMLRALQTHFRRLHLVRARMEAGENAVQAMKSLQPPVFFKQEPQFRAQMQRWSLPALGRVMQRLQALEAQCKQTGMPAETLCSQALLAISAAK